MFFLLRALSNVVPADAQTECQNVIAMLQPHITLDITDRAFAASGIAPKDIADHARVEEHLSKLDRDVQRCMAMTAKKFVGHQKLLGAARKTCADASRLQSAVGLILCGKASETLMRQSASLSNDVEQDPHIVAWRTFLTNEEYREKYRRMLVPIVNGHTSAITSSAH